MSIIPVPKKMAIHGGEPLTLPPEIHARCVDVHSDSFNIIEQLAAPVKALSSGAIDVLACKDLPPGGQALLTVTLDANMARREYVVDVSDKITIAGGSVNAIRWGAVSLFQLISPAPRTPGQWVVPRCRVEDSPAFPYIGLLVDVARKWHPLAVLKQCIRLCWWYKISYLHIHFSDNQSFTLPMRSYPKLSTKKRHYSEEEIKELDRCARAHGVTIIPEIDLPGHSMALVRAYPEIFAVKTFKNAPWGRKRWNVINIGKEGATKAVETIIREACALFPDSPYFHIGADEVNFKAYDGDPDVERACKELRLSDSKELYRHFITRMNDVVRSCNKEMCVWEGFGPGGQVQIPTDVIVFVFESLYNTADNLISDGYRVVNTSWQPIYVTPRRSWTPEEIHGWSPYRWENWVKYSKAYEAPIDVPPSPLLLGAQMCSWEQAAGMEIPSLRHRLAAFSDRAWNPGSKADFEDFQRRLGAQDEKLEALIQAWPA